MKIIDDKRYEDKDIITSKGTENKLVFLGYLYNYELVTDKTTILTDNTDVATITITKYNYSNELIEDTETIKVLINDIEYDIEIIAGIGMLEVSTESIEPILIKTNNFNAYNSEVVINA